MPDWRVLAAPLAYAVHIIVPGLAHQRPRAQAGLKLKGAGSKKDGSEQAGTLQFPWDKLQPDCRCTKPLSGNVEQ